MNNPALTEANETITQLKQRNAKLEQDRVTLMDAIRQFASIDYLSANYDQLAYAAVQRAKVLIEEMGGKMR